MPKASYACEPGSPGFFTIIVRFEKNKPKAEKSRTCGKGRRRIAVDARFVCEPIPMGTTDRRGRAESKSGIRRA